MTTTLGLVANVFNEANALPGWLETHLPFFDDVRVLHAGPQGQYSDDGTIEILEKWNVSVEFCAIDEGFGTVRTRAIRMSPCDYVMVLDADERFYPLHRLLCCEGESTPQEEVDRILRGYDFRKEGGPNWSEVVKLGSGLRVSHGEINDQGQYLRHILDTYNVDAVRTMRRHWHDLAMKQPTQDWNREPDWQLRIVRNRDGIGFDATTRMHERLLGADNVWGANIQFGPFFEHFHFHFKRMEIAQRRHDVDIYDRIHNGEVPLTLEQYNEKRANGT